MFEERGRKIGVRKLLAAAVAVGLSGWLALPALASVGLPSAPSGVEQLPVDVLPGLNLLAPTGAAPAGQVLQIGVGLSLPNLAGAKTYEQSEYDPSSPNYHHFLTPAQFDSMFGVPAQTYDRVVSWLRSGGLTITQTTGAGDWVAASGTVAQLDKLFSTSIDSYSVKGVSFVANTTAPTVPAGDSILTVVGLNTLQRFSTPKAPAGAAVPAASGPSVPGCLPSCTYGPSDMWSVYDMPASDTGQGQSLAIFGEGRTDNVISDLRDFENNYKLPQVPVTVKNVGAGPFSDNSGQVEWDLDTQSSTGVAPGLYNVDLYFANSLYDASVESLFTKWVTDNIDKQANASFGECETNPTNPVTGPLAQLPYGSELGDDLQPVAEATLLEATTQGQTLFASAGDTGSSCPAIVLPVVGAGNGVANQGVPLDNYPCASDYAVCVGGTVLWSDGNTPPQRAIERAWEFTGGGAALFQAQPAFQKGVSAINVPCVADYTVSPFAPGTICRGAPDVAAMSGDISDNGYNIYESGALVQGGGAGTSLSSPLWVGMWSRIQAAAPGATQADGTMAYPGLGFADPLIYKTAENATDYAKDFFDVTLGDNGVYHAAPGWDYVSGWGVPDVTNLMETLDGGNTKPVNNISPTPPPPPSTGSCNALWISQAHTATDLFGNSDPQLTLLEGDMAPGPNGTLAVKLTVENLSQTVPAGATGADWYMTWTYNGTEYFAQAQIGPAPGVAPTFDDGTVNKVGSSNQYQAANTDTGSFKLGKDGVVEIDVPLKNVGNPPAGATLSQPAGATYIEVGVPPNPTGAGVASLQGVDAGGPTNNYSVGSTTGTSGCTLPE
ncbi:MAG TPA: S53 family peptidase [Acidimicrobiales bacterium]|nr:S53 family peptidase [Acidimicrobiales bacterium]